MFKIRKYLEFQYHDFKRELSPFGIMHYSLYKKQRWISFQFYTALCFDNSQANSLIGSVVSHTSDC